MAIDPNIASGIKAPALPNLGALQEQQMSLRNMASQSALQDQQSQINQQNIQKGQIEQEQQAKDLQSKQDYEDSVKAHTSWDPDKGLVIDHDAIQNDLIQKGHPDVAAAHAANQVAVHKAALDDAEKEITVHAKKADRLASLAQSVLSANPNDKPGAYAVALQTAQQEGLLDPNQMHQVPQQYDPATTDGMLQQLASSSLSAKDQLDQAQKKVVEQRAKADEDRKVLADGQALAQSKATTEKQNIENESQILGAANTPVGWANALAKLSPERRALYPAQYSEEARQQAAMQGISASALATLQKADSPADFAAAIAKGGKTGEEAKKALDILQRYNISTETAKVIAANNAALGPGGNRVVPAGTPGERNEAALQGVPQGAATTVKQLVDYKIPLPSGMALKTPYWQNILSLAGEYDPDFDASQYNVRQKLRMDFTSGKSAENIRSLNTAVGHLDTLNKAAAALKNSSFKPYNTVANAAANMTGDKRTTDFSLAANAVAGELTKVFRGTGGSEQDIKDWKKTLDAAGSPDQMKSAIDGAVELMGSRMDALNSQYEKGMGKPKSFSFLDDRAKKILKGLGADVDSLDPVKGSTQTAPVAPATPKASVTPASGQKITEDLLKQALTHNKLPDTPANRKAVKKAFTDRGYTE